MTSSAEPLALPPGETAKLLAGQWRRLTRAATFVALLTSPIAFSWFYGYKGYSALVSAALTFLCVIAFRGLVDLLFRRAIPWPSLFGSDSLQLREEDVMARKRVWFWRFWTKTAIYTTLINTVAWLAFAPEGTSWAGTWGLMGGRAKEILSTPTLWVQVVFVFFLFIANSLIFFGPLLIMNLWKRRVRSLRTGRGASPRDLKTLVLKSVEVADSLSIAFASAGFLVGVDALEFASIVMATFGCGVRVGRACSRGR